MDEKLMVALADLLPRADEEGQWIVLHIDSDETLDTLSNMGNLMERRLLMARVDRVWANIIEIEKKPDRDILIATEKLKSGESRK